MSYNFLGASPGTPMGYDLLALQYLYGARPNHASDDTYAIRHELRSTNTFWTGSSISTRPMATKQTIWDSGGYNVLDLSGLAAIGFRVTASISTLGLAVDLGRLSNDLPRVGDGHRTGGIDR